MIGRCHCGRVVFRIRKEPPAVAGRCNCSFCVRRGWVGSAASLEEFELLEGEEALRCYRFGAGRSQNWFCSVCGIHTHFLNTCDEPHDIKYNLACIDEVDLDALEIFSIDGRSY